MENDRGKTVEVGPIKFYHDIERFNKKIYRQYVWPLAILRKLLLKFKFADAMRFYTYCLGWVTKNKKRAERVCRFSDLYSAYTMNSWVFASDNTRDLLNQIDDCDKECFDFDITKIDWREYWHNTLAPRQSIVQQNTVPQFPPASPSGSSSLTNSHCWLWPSAM